jgi:anti-sigma28 factor (negative regulator of flagellin synthesis)
MAELKDKIEVSTSAEQAHIAEVADRVRLGTYNIDSSLIAERIMSGLIPAEDK